ncbi:MAG: NADP-dependent oxidoreductase [Pseudomonadota bacterium]
MSDPAVEVLLKSRPVGAPKETDFEVRETAAPTPGEGEMLLRLVHLSVDPYLRGRMNDVKSYVPPFALGEPLESGAVAEVVASNGGPFAVGDAVTGRMKWASLLTHDGEGLTKLDKSMGKLSHALGVLGMPGMTAWAGLTLHGRPKEGETIVVSAATGAVGSLVCQLAKRKGLRVVGVAGGPEKCAYAVEELGCDACVDHRDPELTAKLKAACPDGVDIYFENVGGPTLEATLPLLNDFARIPLCGMISGYNATAPFEGADRFGPFWRLCLVRRVTVRGFIVTDHWGDYPKFLAEVAPLVASGEIKARESVTEGLENAPAAFISLLEGGNFGKAVVTVGPEPA